MTQPCPEPEPPPTPDAGTTPGGSRRASAPPRTLIWRQAVSIALAVAPFGLAFGVAAHDARLSLAQAAGFSTLVFTGGAQFAAVTVLRDGGTAAAAVASGLLLNLRTLAFGVSVAPALRGRFGFRAAAAQLVVDESTAVATAQRELRWQRYGFLVAGLSVFVVWNLCTLAGFTLLGGTGDLIEKTGIDATIPAVFLALLWPRLAEPRQRVAIAAGAAIAWLLAPVAPAGIPIVAAAGAVALARPWSTPPAASAEGPDDPPAGGQP